MRSEAWLAAGLIVALASMQACFPREGEGFVRAEFSVTDCPPGEDNGDLEGYGFDAAFLGTTRFNDTVSIQLFEHPVLQEETDGLAAWIDIGRLQRDGHLALDEASDRLVLTQPPLILPLSMERDEARASLSMFQTCPDFPTVHALSGTLTLDVLRIARDPEGLGNDERVEGSITATVGRGAPPLVPVGTLTSEFQFEVPRRPLMTFE